MTTRNPAPLPDNSTPAPLGPLDRAPAPVPVPDSQPVRPLGPPDRAPDPVSPIADPELPQPAPRPRVQVQVPAEQENPYQETQSRTVTPVPELPVPEPEPEPDDIIPNTDRYITVSQDGTVVINNAAVLNFTGGVTVTGANDIATITITASSDYGNANVTALLSNLGANNITTTGNITAGSLSGNGTGITNLAWGNVTGAPAFITVANLSVITTTASGNGSLSYNNTTGVFTFTPANAGLSQYGDANVVSLLAGFGSNTVSTTGNVTAGIMSADYVQFLDSGSVTESYISETGFIVGSNNSATVATLQAQDVRIITDFNGGGATWTFDASGDLSAPGSVATTGNVIADGTVQGNVVTADSAINTAGTIAATGNITGGNIDTDGMITANNQVYAQYFTLKGPGAAGTSIGTLGYGGNIVELQGTEGVNIITTADEGGPSWQFDTTGNLSLAGNLQFPNGAEIRDVNGDLRLRAAPGDVTQLQGLTTDGAVDAAVRTFHDIETGGYVTINTNIDATEHVWTFDYNGDLTVPNYINFAGNTYIGDEPGAGSPAFRIVAPLTYGATIETDSGAEVGNNWTWTFGADGVLTAPGNVRMGDVGASAVSQINTVANSSGDGNGYTTLQLIPDENLTGSDQYIIIDPTAPGHIHIRAGGTQDNSSADLILGGEISNVRVTAGANPPVYVSANNQSWTFGVDGVLTAPGDIVSGDGANLVLGNAASQLQQNGSNAYVSLSGSVFLNPDTGASANNGVVIGGNGYLLAPNSSRNAVLNYGGSSGTMGIYRVNIYGNQTTAIINGGTSGVGNIGANTTNRFNTAFLTEVDASGNIAAGNVIVTGTLYGLSGNVSASMDVGTDLNVGGNVTAGNFIGAGANVELVAGSYTWTFDDTGNAAFANGTVSANNVTLTGNIDANVGGYNIGYREIPQVTLSADANVALADSGKHFYSTTAGNLNLLIPTNANVAFPTGTAFTIVVQAAGNVLVNADSGVNLYLAGNSTAGNRVVSTYGMATVMKVASDTWFINGTGVA